jgi:SPP1 gp7 family putative phage head morphogenesis protein
LSADILQTIFDSVLKAKSEGWTLKQFQDNLLPDLEEKGWAGAKPHRLKVIYDTNMRMAQSKGKFRKQKSVAAIYPYWVYKQIERKNKRHDHSKWNNRKFRHDDPIWNVIYPPSDFGCGCTVVPVKDSTGVENGDNFIKNLNDNSYKLSPLKTWEPETNKYVSGLKSKLEQILSTANQGEKNR